MATAKKSKPTYERRIAPEGWGGIASMELADDGRAFAGRKLGAFVCAWDPAGTLAWTTALPNDNEFVSAAIQLVDDTLIAYVGGTVAWVLDAATGAITKTLELPKYAQGLFVMPDRTRVIVGVATHHVLLGWPSLTPLSEPAEDVIASSVPAVTADGRFYALSSSTASELFQVDPPGHVRSIRQPTRPWCMLLTRDDLLITADSDAMIRWYSLDGTPLANLHAAPDSKKKTLPITALAFDGRHLAAAREDGAVTVFDAEKNLVATFAKHQTELNRRMHTIGAVAFSSDGSKLWVSAAPKGQPPGLTIHPIPDGAK